MSALGETSGLRLQLLAAFKGKVTSFVERGDQLDINVSPKFDENDKAALEVKINNTAPDLKYVIKTELV